MRIRSKSVLSWLILAAMITLGATSAQSAIISYNSANPANAVSAGGPFTIGSLFEVGATPITISHLGAQDTDNPNANEVTQDGTRAYGDSDGFVGGSVAVGIWDATGATLLASVTVTNSDLQIDSYRYAAISGGPITLTANTQYLIGARVGAGIETWLDEHPAANDIYAGNGITFIQNRYAGGGSLAAPTINGTGTLGRWNPANAVFIPEPSSLAMLLFGGVMLWYIGRKRV